MKKSMYIDLAAYFGPPSDRLLRNIPKPIISIQHATENFYQHQNGWAAEQEFDGKNGYLYNYRLKLQQPVSIPIYIAMADLHVSYLIEGTTPIALASASGGIICTTFPQRARYSYLPPDTYQLQFAPGQYHIFGFYFDGGIFRDGNERRFGFLHDLIASYREKSTQPVNSIDFRIDPRTLLYIAQLCENLKKGDFDNEAFILNEMTRLVKLSNDNVFEEYELLDSAQYLIDNAVELIRAYVNTYGQSFDIQHIANGLRVSHAHLCRTFKDKRLSSPKSYKNRYLLERCKKELLHDQQLGDVAERCQFSSVASFSRFFKKHTGQTPGAYKDALYRLHDRVSL